MNLEDQDEEILALRAILGEEVLHFDEKTRTGELIVNLKNEKPLTCFGPDSQKILLDHLPPVMIHFELPSNYPDLGPPMLSFKCPWMSNSQLKVLQKKIHELLEEYKVCNNLNMKLKH